MKDYLFGHQKLKVENNIKTETVICFQIYEISWN